MICSTHLTLLVYCSHFPLGKPIFHPPNGFFGTMVGLLWGLHLTKMQHAGEVRTCNQLEENQKFWSPTWIGYFCLNTSYCIMPWKKSNPTQDVTFMYVTHFFVYFFYIYYIHMYPVSALDNFQDSMLVHVGIPYKCKAHILGNMDRVDPTWVDNLSPVEIVFGWLKGQCDFINKNIIKLYIYVYAIIMSLFIYVWLCFVSLLWKKRPG